MRSLFTKSAVAQALAVAGIALAAPAQAVTLQGGGASLPAPFVRIAGDCWGNKQDLLAYVATGQPLSATQLADFNFTGSPTFDCATQQVDSTNSMRYISIGSGNGVEGYISNDPNRFLRDATWGSSTPYTDVEFAMSDAPLSSTQISLWTTGGSGAQGNIVLRAPGVADDPANANDYPNPQETYGSIIQIPALGTAVAIVYDPVYRRTRNASGQVRGFRFNVQNGAIQLDALSYCKIFNGEITDWTDPALTALNNGVSLKAADDSAAGGIPITIVGRDDKSGTTSIWTRHLAKVCGDLVGSGLSNNYYPDAAQDLATLKASPLTNDEYQKGNENVALAVGTDIPTTNGQTVLNGRVGYAGPDYIKKYAPAGSLGASLGLIGAKLQNANGEFVYPTPDSTRKGLAAVQPPQSTSTGAYDSTQPGDRANPAHWVGALSKNDPLAQPQAPGAFPIVGTSNFLLYTCMALNTERYVLTRAENTANGTTAGFLRWWFASATMNSPTSGILAKSGFTPVPPSYRKAIIETFLSDKHSLDLNIEKAGIAQCVGKPGA